MFDSAEFNQRLFFPRPDASAPPSGAIDRFVSVPGARLHLRLYSPGAAQTVLLFHGNGECVADYDTVAPAFERAGAALAVVDYRGYGKSTGTPTLRAAITDAHEVLKALEPRGRVFVMGRSLGSACANELYGADPSVSGFILESGLTDLRGLLARRGFSPSEPFSEEARRVFDPLHKLRRGDSPLLVLHGTQDAVIAPKEAQAAFDAAGTDTKQLVWVQGRGHNDISASPNYWEALRSFFTQSAKPRVR